ncbi:MAG: radical SAM protein [Candidatus Eremiobacteraeota bacterium]|nr:radical SAM protein [Candidatus Eremiobacteraeota bacterium]
MTKKSACKNILIVNPWIVDFKAFDFWIKPLGLLYIASILKKNHYNINLIDCIDRHHPSVEGKTRFRPDGTGKFYDTRIDKPAFYRDIPRRYKRYGLPIDTFRKELERIPAPDVILVTSVMTYWYPGAHLAIEILKRRFPETPVMLGGIYPTLCPDFAEKKSGADIVISKFNIADFLEIIGDITGTTPDFIPNGFPEFPYPAFQLYEKISYGTILTSMGCPFNCSYCASKRLYPGFIQRNPQDVADEIIYMADNFNIDKFAFYDDALLVNAGSHLIPMLERILNSGKKLRFFTPNGLHARFITPEVASLMCKTGFEDIRLSLETSDEEMLRKTGGKVTAGELTGALNRLEKAGYNSGDIAIYIMMGLPGQTVEECNRTLDFIHNARAQVRLSNYSPVPGTADFENLRGSYGDKPDNPLFHNNTYHHYKGPGMSFEEREYLKKRSFKLNSKILNRTSV